MNDTQRITPWAWIPTLYFAQGIPYFIVNNISVMMFTKMGVPNGEMALFTSLQTFLEPLCRHRQDQALVDGHHAGDHVGSLYSADALHSASR